MSTGNCSRGLVCRTVVRRFRCGTAETGPRPVAALSPASIDCGILVSVKTGAAMSSEQHAWLLEDEKRWQRAHRIAARRVGVDVSGVYRVLRNLEKTPSQRLAAALRHGRLFGSNRR